MSHEGYLAAGQDQSGRVNGLTIFDDCIARLGACAAMLAVRSTLASKSNNLCTVPSLLAPWPRCGASLAHA